MQRRRETINLGGQDYEVPAQRLFDYLSRQDELNIQLLKAISQLTDAVRMGAGAGNGGSTIPTSFLIPQKGQLESGQVLPYAIRRVSLAAALTDSLITEEGWNLVAVTDGIMDNIEIKLNNKDLNNLAIPMKFMKVSRQPFSRLYITSPAQAGKTLFLGISKLAEYSLDTNMQGLVGASGGTQTIFSAAFGAVPAGIYFTTMVDCRTLSKVTLRVDNTLDQAITLYVIGNIQNASATAAEQGPLIPVAAGDSVEVGVTDGFLAPYVGMEIFVAVNPGAGALNIYAVPQE